MPFQRDFERIRARNEARNDALARFPDPPTLLGFLHGPGGDPEAKNQVLLALVRAAQGNPALAETASTLLLLGLWPGLDAVYRQLVRHFAEDTETLAAEMTGRFAVEIRRIDPDRVRRIAATVTRNIKRDVLRDLRRGWQRPEDLDDFAIEPVDPMSLRGSCLGVCVAGSTDAAIPILTRALTAELGMDAALVVAVAVGGVSQKDAAAALGLSHDALRKRYQRALGQLRGSCF